MTNANRAEALESLRAEALALGCTEEDLESIRSELCCTEEKLDEMECQTLKALVKKVSKAAPQKAEVAYDEHSLYVTKANGTTCAFQEDTEDKELQRLLAEGVLYFNDKGELRLDVDDADGYELAHQRKKLREPVQQTVYEFELPPYRNMKPYKTGDMTVRMMYRKPENLIRDELKKKLGKEPSKAQMDVAVRKAHKYINRSAKGRPYEVAMAQVFYNEGFTPFIADEVWHKDSSIVDEQTDLYVCGLPIELKSFKSLTGYSIDIHGEEHLFVCSAHSYERKPEGLRYYLLGYKDPSSRVYLSQTYKLGWVGVFEPVVVPAGHISLVKKQWTTPYNETEVGMFVKASDAINFKTFLAELKQHREAQKANSRQLTAVEVMKLMYPHLKTEEELQVLHPSISIAQLKALYHNELLEPQLEKLRQERKEMLTEEEW